MRTLARRFLARIGLTGKLLLHVGWILAVTIGLLLYLTWAGARAGIRDELRVTQKVRIQQWSARHGPALRAKDAWKIAQAIEELARDPYVVFAGLYDAGGRSIAGAGDESSYQRPHRLDLIAAVRTGPGGAAAAVAEGPPLPGLVRDPERAAQAAPFAERFREVLETSGGPGEEILGWVEVTLDTGPLDAVAWRAIRPLFLIAGLCFAGGLILTGLLARGVVVPLRLIRQNVDLVAEGGQDVPFDEVPRPVDEVGDLATRFSIMTGRIRRDYDNLMQRIRHLEDRIEAEERRRR